MPGQLGQEFLRLVQVRAAALASGMSADPEPRTLTYLHPRAGALRLAASELDVPDLPEARIVVYTPRDDETRAKLPLTRRTPASASVIG
jgi:hypothetical protein